jgi:tRNA (guanine-N7-)-methyltransferase
LVPGDGPLEIEIGSGRGGFLFERANARPDVRLLGFEIRLKWAALVDERLRAQGLGGRARVFNADAREALRLLSPEGSVSTFFVHFPDPWWKKRHEKRLVVSDDLLTEMVRLLVDGGEIFVQTDVLERFDLYVAALSAHPLLAPAGDSAPEPRLRDNPYDARSPRELRALADGLPIHRMRYRRRHRTV